MVEKVYGRLSADELATRLQACVAPGSEPVGSDGLDGLDGLAGASNPAEKEADLGAQGRNRTAHTRIFNPTLAPAETSASSPDDGAREASALVIAWCNGAPERAGEVAFVQGEAAVLGRGEPEGTEPRVRFVRQRPGSIAPAGPLTGNGISRAQLRLRARPGGIEVTQIGRCPLLVNGRATGYALVAPGDTVMLKRELLLLCVRRPVEIAPLRHFPREAMREPGQPDAHGVIGEGPAAWQLRERIAFSAKADAHVLLLGPSGTGKELAARAIHALSARAAGPLVARNAATLPGGLIDAELFGNVKNYPNPGMADRPGLIGQAHGGTLFLDEIGELPAELQAHLLRVIDEGGEYQRLGEAQARRADLRLLAATNRAPEKLKHDLRARLTLEIALPSLHDRREDIPLLARHLLLRAARKTPDLGAQFVARWDGQDGEPRVDPALVERLVRHRYGLHVRELDGLLWRAMAGSPGDVVALTAEVDAALDGSLDQAAADREPESEPPLYLVDGEPGPAEIRASIERNGGNLARASKALGLKSRFALYRLLKKHGMDPKRVRG